MLRVPMSFAKPGMVLALSMSHPRNAGTVLLKAGVRLDGSLILRLREIRCVDCWIEYPGLEQIASFVSPEIFGHQQRLVELIGEEFERVQEDSEARLNFAGYRRGVMGLLDSIRENNRAALYLNEMMDFHRPALRHGANVCMMSLLVGLKIDFYLVRERSRLPASAARDVSSLGLAGLLHDIGMMRLDEDVLERWSVDLDETDSEWREHVTLGYEMIRGEVDATCSSAILHHHQHFDGSGFPLRRRLSGPLRALSGHDIHIFARIIAACDLFDRMRCPPKRLDPAIPMDELRDDMEESLDQWEPEPIVRTLRRLITGHQRAWIDPLVLKGLIAVIPPYGPGSMVELSNGVVGAVVDWNPSNPCRPTVVCLPELSEQGDGRRKQRIDPDEIGKRVVYDLCERTDLCVARIDGHDVAGDNFYPIEANEFDLLAASKSMLNRVDELERGKGRGGSSTAA